MSRAYVWLVLAALLLGLSPADAAKVLYVQNLSQRDTVKLINILQAQGHELTVWTTAAGADGNALSAQQYADRGYQLLIVDEVISSSSVGANFRNSPIPVITWEGYIYNGNRSAFNADSGLIGDTYTDPVAAAAVNGGAGADFGQVQAQTAVNIVDPDHPLAAGLPAGLVDVFDPNHVSPADPATDFDGNGVITFAGARTFIPGVEVVATVPDFANGYAIFGVDAGVSNADGTTTQARWAHLPWNDTDEAERVMVEPSFFLFEAAVAWALDLPAPPKIRDLLPENRGFLATSTPVSFSVDKTTASGSAVAQTDIHLAVNGADVIGGATVSDGGTRWNVTYTGGFDANGIFTIVASATAADGGFSARQTSFDTFDLSNFTFEAEDFNFDGGMFFDEIVLCDTVGGGVQGCYFDRVGVQGIDKNEINQTVTIDFPTSNEVYRFGVQYDREEFTDTFLTGDPLVRQQYVDADIPDYEVRSIAVGEWLNYTRTFPAGAYNIYARLASGNPLTIQMDLVDDRTVENPTLTKLGRFVSNRTAGYILVPLTDDSGQTPLVVEFHGTPKTIRVTALSAGFAPNFYMFVPSAEPANEPPTVTLTGPADGAESAEGTEITITAEADDDGTVAKVEFFAGTDEPLTLLGEDTVAPYSFSFTPPTLGAISTYTIRAVATDDRGLTGQNEISIKVVGSSIVVVTTAVGSGADVQLNENSDSSNNGDALNTRTSSNGDRNEVVALRFDLSGCTLADATDVSLNLINFRDNSARQVALYGVARGTVGDTGLFTTEDWDETGLADFGDMPGLLMTDFDYLTQSLNMDRLTPLGQITFSSLAKGTVETFDDPALTDFVRSYTGSSLVTFLLAAAPGYTSSGQARFASKEATALADGAPAGEAGDFAPYLSFKVAAPEIHISTFSLNGDQLTLTWDGGAGPYTVQKKVALQDQWGDEVTGIDAATVTVTLSGNSGFYRVKGP